MNSGERERAERRLAAIVAADVAGWSRLIGTDEEGTLAALRALRAEIIDPTIAEHRGRLVKTTGDGLLVEFASVVDALRCAIAWQTGIPADSPIAYRIGINVGDVVVEADGDIFGDGVNVAARLEALAAPGGICVSARVQEDAAGRLDLAFEDLGEQALKNIARPVRVYRVALTRLAPAALGTLSRNAGEGRPAAQRPVGESGAALALPDKPSIAVLPFQNMSGDAEQAYFADGMVEEIITALSRIRWLFVIARNSSFAYKGQSVDVKQVGRELGVRYVLEGSVRKAGNRVRITAQLIEAETGTHLWADRFDGALEDVFDLQDQVAIKVVGAIEPSMRQSEIERARYKRPDSLDAYDLYLRALPLVTTCMPDDADLALPLLVEAVRLEPNYAVAHAMIAWCHEQRWVRGGLHDETRATASRHARTAIAVGSDDAAALAVGGFVIGVIEHDFQVALDALDRSLALNPSAALTYGFSAIIRAWSGDDETAVAHAAAALRHSPYDPLIWMPFVGLAYAHFFAGRFEAALSAAARAIQGNPRFSVPFYMRTAALVRLGRQDDAEASARQLLQLQPGFTISLLTNSRITSEENLSMLADALRRAGLPEH